MQKYSKKEILELLNKKILFSDGAMGTMLQKKGFKKGCPDELNLSKPEMIKEIQKEYYEAGADIIITNTFGANSFKLKQYGLLDKLEKINSAAIKNAREAAPNAIIAGDIAPLGKYIEPLDELDFDSAYKAYKEQVQALKEADILIIETISDIKILKAALIAAKETDKLIITSMTFEDGRSVTGTDVKTYTKIADCLGADIIGANCSAGPQGLLEVAKIICSNTNKPVMIQPNAGLPKLVDGKTIFDSNPEEFSSYAEKFVKAGVNILGGCCGTTPEYIKMLVKKAKNLKPVKRNNILKTCFCSRTKTIELTKEKTLIVGERINPSGRKDFQEEIKKNSTASIRREAIMQKKEGASLLDINVGIPGTNEVLNLKKAVEIVQNTVDLPIVIDSSNKKAVEEALKKSDGKPLINSVNLEEKSLNTILPLAKKYGAGIIALCLDKEGIPKTSEKRVDIARKIIKKAEEFGIDKKDIIVDSLVLTIATNPENEKIILSSLKEIKKLGYNTILGVSNISFGLPNRSEINQKFFTKASKAGLSLAILNPKDNILREDTDISIDTNKEETDYQNMNINDKIYSAILTGDKENILSFLEEGLNKLNPLKINDIMIKALKEVGTRFNTKKFFLPDVLQSASSMKIAFERIKEELKESGEKEKEKIVFATVENDIHDIGKNIVIAILESNGYNVIDLGKDVPMNKIIDKALEEKADVICLSAIMTTTAPEMEKIIKELKKRNINIPVVAGGAVITPDYAKDISAFYSQDAIGSVNLIKKIIEEKNANKKNN